MLTWPNEPHPQPEMIDVWGMDGVGKTALLQLIHNNCKENYKKKVKSIFDFVIWYTIPQNYKMESLQDTIVKSLNLKFDSSSSWK